VTTGFAILGSGMIAEYHRDAISANVDEGAELVAVATRDESRFSDVGRAFGVPCVTEQELLARDDVDVVCICTPSGLHAEQAVRAAEAGKHLLIEKPIALSLDEADAIIAAADASGTLVGVALQRRADPAFRRVADAVAAGELGQLTLGTLTIPYHRPQTYYDQAPWRGTWALDGGGVLMNQGIHLLDLLVWMLGDPVEVQAHAATLARAIEVEDTLVAALRFAHGALATVSATTATRPGAPHRIELFGTDGFVRIEGELVVAWQTGDGEILVEEAGAQDAGPASHPRGIALDGHVRIVRDFLGAIRERRPPLVDAAEARRSLAAALAIYEAASIRSPAADPR
jgi:UDP-N-acetyl-2-amino-2-deoxyglucuronate dehydrogenase